LQCYTWDAVLCIRMPTINKNKHFFDVSVVTHPPAPAHVLVVP
jgi:hypothetical protein